MDIKDNTIHFKSVEEMYNKERDGIKSNTVRILSKKELKDVTEMEFKHIKITKVGSDHYFTRWLTDVSYLYSTDCAIIICVFSW